MPKTYNALTPDETFGIDVTSPELSQKDKGPNANTWAVVMPQMIALLQTGLHTPDSIGKAIAQFTQEMLELKIVPLTADEFEQKKQEAMQQMQQQQAQAAEQKAQEQPGKQPSPFQKKQSVDVPKVGRQPKPEIENAELEKNA